MPAQVLEEKKPMSRIVDALAIGGVAVAGDAVLNMTPLGTGILGSLVEMGGGLVFSGIGKGKFSEYLGAGLLVSGSLHLINSVIGGKLSFGAKNAQSQASSGSVFI